MALIKILSDLASDLGVSLNVPSEKSWLIERVNDVAKEKYRENDLKGCEREQLFQFGQYDQEVSLPQYMEKVIALREYSTRLSVKQLDMRPRYMSNTWRQPFLGYPYFKFRLKGTSCLKADIAQSSYITFTLPLANSKLFSVIVTGETANAKRVQEVVFFNAGDLTHTTQGQFVSVDSIRKSSATDVDVLVTDIDGRELASIPNNELNSVYKVFQILERNEYPTSIMLYEVLYKLRYQPFVNDYDEFTCGDIYDESIYWATLSKIYQREDGKEQKAMLCHNKAEACMTRIAMTEDGPLDVRINFGKNQVFQQFSRMGQSVTTAKPYRPLYAGSLK